MLGGMTRIIPILTVIALAGFLSGCAVACGGSRYPSPQELHVTTDYPASYTIRVLAHEPIDTPVPQDGRVAVDVPIFSRQCRQYLFGVVPLTPTRHIERERVICVLRGDRVVQRLSATDIAKLPADAEGYHILRIQQ